MGDESSSTTGQPDNLTRRNVLGPAPVRWAIAAVGIACAAAHLYSIAADIRWLHVATKPPLMLLLAATAPLIAGLILASAGDTVLLVDFDLAFLIGLLLFAGTHLCYIIGCIKLFPLETGHPPAPSRTPRKVH